MAVPDRRASAELERIGPSAAASGDITKPGVAQDKACARLVAMGWPPSEIAEHLGIRAANGRSAEYLVVAAVKRSVADWVTWSRDERRVMQVVTLEAMKRTLWRALEEIRMYVVSNGRLVVDAHGDMLEDWRFKLEVVDRLLKVEEQIAKLTGTHAPRETVTITRDNVEEEILRLERELGLVSGTES